ncbi:hypothetical protein BKA69DRAFT_1072202 [Paraphysoderma sedebokerense]|nr:hypothetical protein BKA69DRAFT_1072142 [Paraphysoderma sedebokerense]KAI9141709.1 hypothetical protein BKA69DRAFT_1072202 [Paraphysoderma sedebokerense]
MCASFLPSRPTPYLIRPRPIPSFFYLSSSILIYFTTPSSLHDSSTAFPFFLTFFSFLTTWFICFLKSIWIPNPKDDIFSPSTWRERLKTYGFLGVIWVGSILCDRLFLESDDAMTLIGVKAILPILVHFLSRKYTLRRGTTTALLTTLSLLFVGAIIISTSSSRVSSFGIIVLGIISASCTSVAFVFMEKVLMDTTKDPWVFVTDYIPLSTILSFVLFLLFESYRFPFTQINTHFTPMIQSSVLTAIYLISTSFLISCLSSISFSVFSTLRDSIFFIFFWAYYTSQVRPWGVIGLISIWAGVWRFNIGTGEGMNNDGARYVQLGVVSDDSAVS